MKSGIVFFRDKIFSIICLILLVLILSNTALLFVNKKDMGYRKEVTKDIKILEIWDIVSFDSGNYSKTKFLENVSKLFYSKNKNICFIVKQMTESGAVEALKTSTPDLISYGGFQTGVVKNVIQNTIVENKKFISEIKTQNKIVGLPWCASAYYVFYDKEQVLKTSDNFVLNNIFDYGYVKKTKKYQKNITSVIWGDVGCEQALNKNDVTIRQNNRCGSGYDAYLNFVNGKSVCLVGTNRDFCRIYSKDENKEKIGFEMLTEYTNLVQYVSICSNDEDKIELCQKFLNFMFDDDVQKKMQGLGLFSCILFEDFESDEFKDLQQKFNGIKYIEEVLL